jgi:phenylacetate-CoA oxygenase PaaH subunit
VKLGTEDDIYEVFARYGGQGDPIRWVGSVRAAEPVLAWHAAKEAYTRREQCSVLWVAKRSAMVFSTAGDVEALASAARLDYRTPGFPVRHRRDRERAAQAAPSAQGPQGPQGPHADVPTAAS